MKKILISSLMIFSVILNANEYNSYQEKLENYQNMKNGAVQLDVAGMGMFNDVDLMGNIKNNKKVELDSEIVEKYENLSYYELKKIENNISDNEREEFKYVMAKRVNLLVNEGDPDKDFKKRLNEKNNSSIIKSSGTNLIN